LYHRQIVFLFIVVFLAFFASERLARAGTGKGRSNNSRPDIIEFFFRRRGAGVRCGLRSVANYDGAQGFMVTIT
jgi:hypothetical protein